MGQINLKIEDLILDHDNPRITHAAGQQEALQKIVLDQKSKLVKLAQSIAEHGMNPMDRMLVLRSNQTPIRYIALEGNRRVAVFKILVKPAVMSGLDMPAPMKRIFERLAGNFKKSLVEPLPCFELSSREEGRYWLNLRHNKGHEGAGVDDWKSFAKRRFDGKPPSMQVMDLVTDQSGLTPAERSSITEKFPTSTLERLIENTAVRAQLGLDIKDGKIVTKLPAVEVAKSLKKIVLDLATKKIQVGELMKTPAMLEYLKQGLGKAHLPDLSKKRTEERSLDEIPTSEFAKLKSVTPRRKPDPSDRKEVVPKGCPLNVTDNRIAEIYRELRLLKLEDHRNAIAVLMRVFLELSVDHFLESNGIPLDIKQSSGRTTWKALDMKLGEVVNALVSAGVPRAHFAAVTRSLSVATSPLYLNLLHMYIHDRYATPSPKELVGAWNAAQPLFEKIWP